MIEEPGCKVCEDRDHINKENFLLKLNEKPICVSCLSKSLTNPYSDPNSFQFSKTCTTHNRPFDLFCIECETPLCGKCIISHRDHRIDDIDQMNDYIASLKSKFSSKLHQFTANLLKAQEFQKSFENFLTQLNNNEKNDFSLATSCFFQDTKAYEDLLNNTKADLIQKCSKDFSLYKNELSRSERQEKKCEFTLKSLEQRKTEAVVLLALFEDSSVLQRVKKFLFVKGSELGS